MNILLKSVLLPTAMAVAFTISPVGAQDKAADHVILRVEGKLRGGKSADFTRTDLEKLGVTTVKTSTPWHDGVQTFEGVPVDTVMQAVGAEGTTALVIALNKYQTEIPLADFSAHKVILALKRGGQYMDVKDKGPLFIIYPFDQEPELKTERYYGRSAWQVRSITVE